MNERTQRIRAGERRRSAMKVRKVRTLVISGAAAAAVALPLMLVSTPAQAATLNGCRVTPLRPVLVGQTASGPRRAIQHACDVCAGHRHRARSATTPGGEWDAGSGSCQRTTTTAGPDT